MEEMGNVERVGIRMMDSSVWVGKGKTGRSEKMSVATKRRTRRIDDKVVILDGHGQKRSMDRSKSPTTENSYEPEPKPFTSAYALNRPSPLIIRWLEPRNPLTTQPDLVCLIY